MTEPRFIELLNLYIDQEISPEEAALLEEEIYSDPDRRQFYQEYCRMHRAMGILHEQFRAGVAPEPEFAPAAQPVEGWPMATAVRGRPAFWRYALGGAVAAGFAVFLAGTYSQGLREYSAARSAGDPEAHVVAVEPVKAAVSASSAGMDTPAPVPASVTAEEPQLPLTASRPELPDFSRDLRLESGWLQQGQPGGFSFSSTQGEPIFQFRPVSTGAGNPEPFSEGRIRRAQPSPEATSFQFQR